MKILFLLLMSFFTISSSASEEARAQSAQHKKTYQEILNRYISTSQWNPESEKALPLEIHEALKVARQWASIKWPEVEAFKIIEVNLKQMVSGREGTWWAYNIVILPEPWVDSYATNRGSEVVVNMDGEVERHKILGTSSYVLTKK